MLYSLLSSLDAQTSSHEKLIVVPEFIMAQLKTHTLDVYQPRNPKASAYCARKVINAYLKSVVSDEDAVPCASIAVQTYGDFLNFNPHLHAIVADGCFLNDGSFRIAPVFILKDLEKIFPHEVFKMLKKKGNK